MENKMNILKYIIICLLLVCSIYLTYYIVKNYNHYLSKNNEKAVVSQNETKAVFYGKVKEFKKISENNFELTVSSLKEENKDVLKTFNISTNDIDIKENDILSINYYVENNKNETTLVRKLNK